MEKVTIQVSLSRRLRRRALFECWREMSPAATSPASTQKELRSTKGAKKSRAG